MLDDLNNMHCDAVGKGGRELSLSCQPVSCQKSWGLYLSGLVLSIQRCEQVDGEHGEQ